MSLVEHPLSLSMSTVTPLQPVNPDTSTFTFCLNVAGFGTKLTTGVPEHADIVVVVAGIVVLVVWYVVGTVVV